MKNKLLLTFISVLLSVSCTRYALATSHSNDNNTFTPEQRLADVTSKNKKFCVTAECETQLIKLKKYARWGDAKAQLALGTAYLYGDGIEQDIEKALFNLQQASWNSSKKSGKYAQKATYMLANIYQKGIGVEVDYEKAASLYEQLAEKKYSPILFENAMLAFVLGNNSKAIELLNQASENKYKPATYLLAQLYQTGQFVTQNLWTSAQYYKPLVTKDYKDSRLQFTNIIKTLETPETNSTTPSLNKNQQELLLIYHQTLDIEVISVVSDSTSNKDAMTAFLDNLNKYKGKYMAATGSRIKGSTCGKTSRSCFGVSGDDLQDIIDEGFGATSFESEGPN